MKKILFNFPGHGHGRLFNPYARDACRDPYIYLRDRLQTQGYVLRTADDHSVQGCAWVWFWNAVGVCRPTYGWRDVARFVRGILLGMRQQERNRWLYQECLQAGLQDRVVLFTGEPPSVLPLNWESSIHELFPTIFTWHDSYVDGNKFHKFCLPLTGRFPEVSDVPFSQRKLLTNISSNKFSSHSRELFTARRKTIRYFEQNHSEEFDLYGMMWNKLKSNQARYSSYRGTVQHKWDVYPHYRFGLCYENIRGEPGYVSEKIFDCMRARCVPIYWGAPNIADYVDTNAFIDRRKFQSDAELADFLLSMAEHEYAQYRQAIQAYLHSEQFAMFLPPAFADTIIRVLSL